MALKQAARLRQELVGRLPERVARLLGLVLLGVPGRLVRLLVVLRLAEVLRRAGWVRRRAPRSRLPFLSVASCLCSSPELSLKIFPDSGRLTRLA
jgi:hypothetical protein